MYHEFYGLKQAPFKITPDTRLFFSGGSRGEILEALVYAISSGEGIVKVVGEVGSGKTMLCRMLEVRLPDQVEIVYLPNPSLTPEDILHNIALEMGVKVDPAANRIHVMQDLHQCLLERHADNRRVVVFVEEAQAMPLETLEEIRLLSNLETQQDKLLQIVLFGQPELDRNLNERSIRQLRERITHSFSLPPLTADDIRHYVRFRLNAVGYRGPDMFEQSAYKAIAGASRGLTRRVNILADKSLLAAFAENTHKVSRRHALKAIGDSEMRSDRSGLARRALPLAAAVAGVAVLVGVALSGVLDPAIEGLSVALTETDKPAETHLDEPAPAPAAETDVATVEPQAPIEPVTMEPADVAPVASASTTEQTVASVTLESESQGSESTGSASPGLESETSDGSADVSWLVAETEVPTAAAAQAKAVGTASSVFTAEPEPAVAVSTSNVELQDAVERNNDLPAGQVAIAEVSEPDNITLPAALEAETPVVLEAELDTADADADQTLSSGTETAASTAEPVETSTPASTTAQVSATEPMSVGATPADPTPEAQTHVASVTESPASVSAGVVEVAPAALPAGANLLEQRLAAARSWLLSADQSHFTIQLLATDVDQGDSLEAFLRGWRTSGRLERIYIYRTRIRGNVWFGVLYDDYKTYSEARAALEDLPEEVKRYKPFIRNVRDIDNLG